MLPWFLNLQPPALPSLFKEPEKTPLVGFARCCGREVDSTPGFGHWLGSSTLWIWWSKWSHCRRGWLEPGIAGSGIPLGSCSWVWTFHGFSLLMFQRKDMGVFWKEWDGLIIIVWWDCWMPNCIFFFVDVFFFQKSVTFFFVFEAAVVLDLFYSFQKVPFCVRQTGM